MFKGIRRFVPCQAKAKMSRKTSNMSTEMFGAVGCILDDRSTRKRNALQRMTLLDH